MNNVVVLILAGGDSSRMWPMSHKTIIPFGKDTLISSNINGLVDAGFSSFIIATNEEIYGQIQFISSQFPQVSITCINQTDSDGMAGAIRSAAHLFEGKSLLIVGGSDWYEPYLYKAVADRISHASQNGFITGVKRSQYFPGGYLVIENGNIIRIVEKPDPKNVPSDWVAVVCDYFPSSDTLVHSLELVSSDRDDTFEKAIQYMIEKNTVFSLLEYTGVWGYAKYPWHILDLVSNFLRSQTTYRGKNVSIHPTAIITGDVHLDDDVRILEYAKIIGPAYIGKGTIVGNFTMIRDSIIGEQCVVGKDTEITRSYIGNACWFHKNYIGDSVLSHHVYFGAGVTTANFRLDGGTIFSGISGKKIDTQRNKLGAIIGERVHIGVHTALMPGVKIGRDSSISAGVVLDADIQNESFCKLVPSSYRVIKNTHLKDTSSDGAIRDNLKF